MPSLRSIEIEAAFLSCAPAITCSISQLLNAKVIIAFASSKLYPRRWKPSPIQNLSRHYSLEPTAIAACASQ